MPRAALSVSRQTERPATMRVVRVVAPKQIGKPERALEQSTPLTGQTLTWAEAGKTLNDIGRLADAKRSMQTLSEGTTHALRTIPIFAASMSQKTRDACAIVFLVHTCKRTRTVRPKGGKYQGGNAQDNQTGARSRHSHTSLTMLSAWADRLAIFPQSQPREGKAPLSARTPNGKIENPPR